MKLQDFIGGGFYINLDHRIDKNEFMMNQLTKLGLDSIIKRFSAVKVSDKTEYTREDPQMMLKLGLATAASHKSIVNIAKKNNWKNVLILEDDALFYNTDEYKAINIIEKALDELNNIPDWDIYYLGSNLCDTELRFHTEHLLRCDCCMSSHAYILNERTFDIILNYSFDKPFDAMDFFLHKTFTNKYITYPAVVLQKGNNISDIGGHPSYGESFWLDQYKNKPIIK